MTLGAAEKIADTILFEGYILYPYRPSAIKNQKRWNFGTLYPREFAEAQRPEEAWRFHAEMLVQGSDASRVTARVRFLEVTPGEAGEGSWEEGFVRTRDFEATLLEMRAGMEHVFDLGAPTAQERLMAPDGYKKQPMRGKLLLQSEELSEGLFRLHTEVRNETPAEASASRACAQRSAFLSAHLVLHVEGGAFVSLLDPEPGLELAVSLCRQQGVFPVLAGEPGDRSCMVCSPIILYDYPRIAPESAGDFFDGTEMDEMLALRVMTLTDEEKAEMRRSDQHARAILERTENLPQDHLLKLHGAVRGMVPSVEAAAGIDGRMEPWDPFAERPPVESVRVFGTDVRRGDRVRLWPQKKADIMDMAMEGKVAIVEAIEQDLEDQIQFAVVLEDDPGRDMGMLRQAGHRFFFSPEEIEPLIPEGV